MIKLTAKQLGRLLLKEAHEPRRGQKRYLKDLGGSGSADELDEVLEVARGTPAAIKEYERLEKQREIIASSVTGEVDQGVAELLADIRAAMDDANLTQSDLAMRSGLTQPQIAAYLTGRKQPGIGNVVRIAQAMGMRLTLAKADGWPMVVR